MYRPADEARAASSLAQYIDQPRLPRDLLNSDRYRPVVANIVGIHRAQFATGPDRPISIAAGRCRQPLRPTGQRQNYIAGAKCRTCRRRFCCSLRDV